MMPSTPDLPRTPLHNAINQEQDSVLSVRNTLGVSGRFRITANAEGGEERVLADWFPNMILNAGLERMCGSGGGLGDRVAVGTNATPPQPTDTALLGFVASTTNNTTNSNGNTTVAPYYAWYQRTWQFTPGQATGVLAEVGVGWAANQMFCRSLIKDPGGTPITLTILSTDYLNITWEFRAYAVTTDTVITPTVLGVPYTVTTRAAELINSNGISASGLFAGFSVPAGYASYAYNGAIGPVTGSPTGTSASMSGDPVWEAYVPGSYQRSWNWNIPPNYWNVPGGIAAIHVRYPATGNFQIGFVPSLPKDGTKSMTLRCTHSVVAI